MFIKKYILPTILFFSLFSCQEKQNTLEGLVDASAHEEEFYDKQISFLDDIIAQRTKDAALFAKRAEIRLKKKDYVASLEDIEYAIEIDSTVGQYYFVSATTHYYLGNMVDAVSFGEKALALGFRHPQLKTFIGSAFMALNQYDSALFYLDNSLKEVPQNSKTHRAIGNTYFEMNNLPLAVINYKKAIALSPLDSLSYAGLIMSYLDQNDIDNAYKSYQVSQEMMLSSGDLNYAYGMILDDKGQYDSALIVFTNGIKLDPKHWKSRRQLGKLYRRYKKPLEANKVFLEGLKYDASIKELWYELGLTNQYSLRNYAEARVNYEKALDIDPTYNDARLALINLKATLRRLYTPPVEETNDSTGEVNTQ